MAQVRAAADEIELLSRLRSTLGDEGLRIVMPLGPADFDAVSSVRGLHLGALMPGARGAVVVGDGGPEFFARFVAASAGGDRNHQQNQELPSADPLDDHTRAVLERASWQAWSPWVNEIRFRCFYPFVNARPALPFQRLGTAAGLPAAGPLGLQVHPVFGPWWAYRALIVVSFRLKKEADVVAPCSGCPRPCVSACPGQAVTGSGLSAERCLTHRSRELACHGSCGARIACPVGNAHRYPVHQLAFHMRASLPSTARESLPLT